MRQSISKSRQPYPEQVVGPPFVGLLRRYLLQRGCRPEELYDAPLADEDRITDARWRELLAIASDKLGEPALGLAVAQQATWRDFGLVGYLASCCATIGEALERGSRYSALIVSRTGTELGFDGDLVCLGWPSTHTRSQLTDEVGVGVITQSLRLAIGDKFSLARVDFVGSSKAVDIYGVFFDCPVRFNQSATRLCFARHYLDLPLPGAEPVLRELLDEQAKGKLQALVPLNGGLHQHRQQLEKLLQQGRTRLSDLAAVNHMSTRALQRRLKLLGCCFQTLLDETRIRLAKEYLADPRLDLLTVANLVGYADQSSFTRAFQQLTGEAPGHWRSTFIGA